MAANVLSSPQAIDASVLVVRTFIQLRRILATSSEVGGRLEAIENHLKKMTRTSRPSLRSFAS
jgi:hypothetical protein